MDLLSAEPIDSHHRAARRWLLLALGSLLVSGLLALALTIGRVPGLGAILPDPLLFKRALVVHVDLALVVWFHAFAAALVSLLPVRGSAGPIEARAPFLAAGGVGLLMAAALQPGAIPVLSNYVPAIDHPLFSAGLVVIGLAIVASVLSPRLFVGNESALSGVQLPQAARPVLRGLAVALTLAGLTFLAAARVTPAYLPAEAWWEVVAWGGGHVLQLASVLTLVATWTILITGATGQELCSRRAATGLVALLVLPALVAPLIALRGTTDGFYRQSFTEAMRWGIFPVLGTFLLLGLRAVWKARAAGLLQPGRPEKPALVAFLASAALTLLGFGLGALIRESSTLVPAHYHASIGAVTCGLMGVTPRLLRELRLGEARPSLQRAVRWQPALFAIGQAIFAIGFGLAGLGGMARKVFGAEQAARTTSQLVGLGVMGIGGLLAVLAGTLFLVFVVDAVRRGRTLETRNERSDAWATRPAHIHSRG